MRIIAASLCVLVVTGCTARESARPGYFDTGDVKQVELYYLDPYARDKSELAAKYTEQFRGWPVIGKTTITDRDTQRAIAASLTRGLDEGLREEMADCFDPHHGLRIETNSGVIEVEICFLCGQAVFVGGPQPGLHPFSQSPQELLDRLLMKAKVLPRGQPAVENEG